MKRLMVIGLIFATIGAHAVESLKTPHGTLALKEVKRKDLPLHSYEITLKGKPVGIIEYGGYTEFLKQHFKLGKQDIYIFTSHSGVAGDKDYYHGLVVVEAGKAKIFEDINFTPSPYEKMTFEVVGGKLIANMGKKEGKIYRMIYDGKSMKIDSQSVPKKTGKQRLKERDCRNLYDMREDVCAYYTQEGLAQYVIRNMEGLIEQPGFNNDELERQCAIDSEKVSTMSYKQIKENFCSN